MALVKWTKDALQVARPFMPLLKLGWATLSLGWDVIQNLRRWWKGEISGKRCVKNIIDCSVGITTGFVAGAVGSSAGTLVGGPVGSFLGGLGIGIKASNAARSLSDRLTRWIFGLPKSEALENAYRFLHLKASASNYEINSAYRKLALQYHPDKVTGNRDKWLQLQYYIAIIREAKEEY